MAQLIALLSEMIRYESVLHVKVKFQPSYITG
jgi:hypothetical protein